MIISTKESTQEKSKRRHIVDTISYIAKIGNKIAKADAVGYRKTLNCKNGFDSYESIDALLMEIVVQAEISFRSDNPIEHLVLSWREEEIPTNEQIDEAVLIALKELGYENCQCVYAVHTDTPNRHCHLFVNRVDLSTFKVCNDSFSKDKMNIAMAKIDAIQGWQSPPNAIYKYDVESKEVIKKRDTQPDQNISSGAIAKEVYSGYKSAERIAKDYVDTLLECSSWKEAQSYMATKGMSIEHREKGAVIKMQFADSTEVFIKPSKLSRELSYNKLIEKWGEFEKYDYAVTPHEMSIVNAEDETLVKALFHNINLRIDKDFEEDFKLPKLYPMPAPARVALRKVIEELKESKKSKNKENYEKALSLKSYVGKIETCKNIDSILNYNEYIDDLPDSFADTKISIVDDVILFDFERFIIKDMGTTVSLIIIDEEDLTIAIELLHKFVLVKGFDLDEISSIGSLRFVSIVTDWHMVQKEGEEVLGFGLE